jgi:polyisoprenoid-binding protein YceI
MRALLVSLLCLAALPAGASDWRMQDGSTLTFESTFEGTPLPGRFVHFDVMLNFDPLNPAGAKLRVSVNLEAADMSDPDMNAAIAGPDWFGVASFPIASYQSSEIVAVAPGQFLARGELDLKGVRQDVDVPFSWTGSGDTAEMRGELMLRRSDFDIGSGEWASGDQIGIDVKLQFSIKLVRDD